jgi:hypothetical protein
MEMHAKTSNGINNDNIGSLFSSSQHNYENGDAFILAPHPHLTDNEITNNITNVKLLVLLALFLTL